ncbi:hypothetical protein Zm00014a_014465, partial [Zea mays]
KTNITLDLSQKTERIS